MNRHQSQRQSIYGLTADAHFLHLLHQPSLTGNIEQVFNKAINFSIDNQLYTLLGSQTDNAPNSCRIINKDFSPLNITTGDSVYILNNEIHIGEKYTISFLLCKKWNPPTVYFINEKLTEEKYRYFLQSKINEIDSILNDKTHSLFNYQGDNCFYLESSKKLNELRSSLINLLINKRYQALTHIVSQFVGLGIGLTPSGDDYLVGLMAFLLLKHHPANSCYPSFYQGISQSKANTTPISAITLEKALNQEYRENMHQLIQCLVDGRETNIYPQILEILNIGSSSGCDMLFGIRDALFLTHYFGETHVD
ncbi:MULTISPECIES: DUF2877 domain-containing protein [unclassified Providencia]|uniref:DUF2877 domain-containing protein n=1 Tax=unclassified Providencia TaxID=2633465 RepID=UPI00139DB270|nr:DUF2877 domain-containing protein [Providencia sp. PROV211]MTC23790.1 DUF2877 domain-containing protein [Providencia sp. wls1938]MTC47735.1 DUF2877 domain-containing protein [Providencia sp. wls1922]MTC78118.1 DUF2877 domain-containing protein [Providencia sp. wls1916]